MRRAGARDRKGSRDRRRAIPAVETILGTDSLRAAAERIPRSILVGSVRESVAAARSDLLRSGAKEAPDEAALAQESLRRAEEKLKPTLRSVINATGVVLHTNLGRAPLAEEAVRAVTEIARNYSTTELDPERGTRGSRMAHVEPLLCELTGAEAALVTTNNAAAMLLAVHALAAGRDVVVSRGELVEIGGSFRIPEILEHAGSSLVEIGTTNRTRLSDYERAIGAGTGAIVRVHQSNFAMFGFTEQVSREDLVRLARRKRIPLIEDLGSGALIDLAAFGLPEEPMLRDAVAAGVSVACASADKLLGGPQAGILVGDRASIAKLKRNPLARALRVDKLILAALEATLRLYRDPDSLGRAIPVLRMLGEDPGRVRARARRLLKALGPERADKAQAEVIASVGEVGGGAMPLARLPSFAVALRAPQGPARLARSLRLGAPPVLARIEANRLLLDLRTVAPRELPLLQEAVRRALDETT